MKDKYRIGWYLHLAPDEKDVKVDGGEDEEGNGDEEEKDVPGIEILPHGAEDEVEFEKVQW